jgi:hypothetical protein
MPVSVTYAAVLSLAGSVGPEIPDQGREVREMRERDLCACCQMLQAICGRRPRSVCPENLSDPGLLGTGEHGAGIVAERAEVGQTVAIQSDASSPAASVTRCVLR